MRECKSKSNTRRTLWCNKSSEALVALSNREAVREGLPHHWPPCLFNHVQLHSRSPSCREITSPVIVTKPSRPEHIGNRLKPNAQPLKDTVAPTPDLLSNNLFDISTILVLGWPWIMEISVITTSGCSQHFPTAHTWDVNSVHPSPNLGPLSVAG